MRLVDREQGELAAVQQRERGGDRSRSGARYSRSSSPARYACLDRAALARRLGGVEERGPDPERGERVDLVLHQRDQRRDDDAGAGADQCRDLVAQRLAAAGRHQHERVAAGDHVSMISAWSPRNFGVAEHRLQHVHRGAGGGRGRGKRSRRGVGHSLVESARTLVWGRGHGQHRAGRAAGGGQRTHIWAVGVGESGIMTMSPSTPGDDLGACARSDHPTPPPDPEARVRKVVLYTLMSLDGAVDHPSRYFAGGQEQGGVPEFDSVMVDNENRIIGAQDTVLLGRRMYDEWSQFWPTRTRSRSPASSTASRSTS